MGVFRVQRAFAAPHYGTVNQQHLNFSKVFWRCFAKAAIWEIGFRMRSLKKCGILMHFDRPK